ncbi:MAG: zinc metallopeptidase [Granulosicoccus sp.]|nr:zinc metallopeptidase [Granulosicoccus sp.]
MLYLIFLGIFLGLTLLPQWWVRRQLRKYSEEIPDLPGTGGELAKHLIDRYELTDIGVEASQNPHDNHFSPADRMIRLSPELYDGKSITAVSVAAHEVGHAIQFHRQEDIFKLRSKYLPLAIALQKAGSFALMAAPVLGILLRSPAGVALPIIFSVTMHLLGALMYLIVLPEEWDASFGKALPILADGYLEEEDLPKAREVLKAAALTYLAGAVANLVSIFFRMLLFRR